MSEATANVPDAELRDRATHTGAQAIGTVTGLQAALAEAWRAASAPEMSDADLALAVDALFGWPVGE